MNRRKPRHYKRDDRWIREHFEELVKSYGGRFVAVANQRVSGVDRTALGAERKSLKRYPKILPSVFHVPDPKDLLCAL